MQKNNRRQAIIWSNADPIRWRIYAALGGDELMPFSNKILGHLQKLYRFIPHELSTLFWNL